MRTVQLFDNDVYTVKSKDIWDEICCDCGLAHTIEIQIINKNKIKIKMKRNDKLTQSIRRRRKAQLQTSSDENGWRIVKIYNS